MPLDFELNPLGFDLDNAYFFATACQIAVERKVDRKRAEAIDALGLLEDSYQSIEFSEDEEFATFRGFVGSAADFGLIAFGDVEQLDRFLTEEFTVQKAGFGGMVHSGFVDSLEVLWTAADLESHINRLGDKDLWITGHGLGGALAVLTAARLDDRGKTIKGVYNFGTPRIANIDFFHSYSVPTYRIVNNNDIYAHVPAENLFTGGFHYQNYKHVGTLRYFDRHKQVGEGTSNWERKKELITRQLMRMGQPPTNWFQDHLIGNYVAAIRKTLTGEA